MTYILVYFVLLYILLYINCQVFIFITVNNIYLHTYIYIKKINIPIIKISLSYTSKHMIKTNNQFNPIDPSFS